MLNKSVSRCFSFKITQSFFAKEFIHHYLIKGCGTITSTECKMYNADRKEWLFLCFGFFKNATAEVSFIRPLHLNCSRKPHYSSKCSK